MAAVSAVAVDHVQFVTLRTTNGDEKQNRTPLVEALERWKADVKTAIPVEVANMLPPVSASHPRKRERSIPTTQWRAWRAPPPS
jgi:hypothetical protein